MESWSEMIVRPVIYGGDGSKVYMAAFFILFQFLTCFGLLNVAVGVIVESVCSAAKQNKAMSVEHRRRALQVQLAVLRSIFEFADTDGCPGVSRKEFAMLKDSPEAVRQLAGIGLEVDDLEEVFDVLDTDGDGIMEIEEFVHQTLRLRGKAKAMDIVEAVCRMKRLERAMLNAGILQPEDFAKRSDGDDLPSFVKRAATHKNSLANGGFAGKSMASLPESSAPHRPLTTRSTEERGPGQPTAPPVLSVVSDEMGSDILGEHEAVRDDRIAPTDVGCAARPGEGHPPDSAAGFAGWLRDQLHRHRGVVDDSLLKYGDSVVAMVEAGGFDVFAQVQESDAAAALAAQCLRSVADALTEVDVPPGEPYHVVSAVAGEDSR